MFDPVLAEIAYQWWCPLGGLIIDPFAGGNVRGMVAGHSGYSYLGVDLSAKQVETNRQELHDALIPPVCRPRWETGDAAQYVWDGVQADFIFSCPPYGTLEQYSDHPDDLSTMKIGEFRKPYKKAILNAVNALKDNRFAAFVVGNYREDKKLVDLVSLTVEAFGEAGADYYGDLILVTPYGTTPLRSAQTFKAARKIVRTHQYLLCFTKGDPFAATKEIDDNAEV
jgi:DNA modification methylase